MKDETGRDRSGSWSEARWIPDVAPKPSFAQVARAGASVAAEVDHRGLELAYLSEQIAELSKP